MDDWQARTRDFYADMWIDRQRSEQWSKPSASLDMYRLCARINTDSWVELLTRLAPGRCLLECGGATGVLTAVMAARGWQCTQIDITREGPLLARERFRAEGVVGMFATANVCRLPFADGTFDVVTSHGLLDLMPDIGTPIAEMTRVLKPGGLFVSSFFPRRRSIQSLANAGLQAARFVRQLFSWSGGENAVPAGPAFDSVFRNNYSLAAYLQTCRAAGLTEIVGKGFMPLPVVPLPESIMHKYVWLAGKLEPQWRAFNKSASSWTAKWGVMLAIYGVKAPPADKP